jgi:cytochrome b involved in lipid metabolism
MSTLPPSTGIFDLTFGLPLHILVNHAVVVLIPLGVLAMVLMVVVPKLRKNFSYLSAGITLLGAIAATVAAQSGEALAQRVGYPGVHQEWGEKLVPVAWALAAVSVVWVVLLRFTNRTVRVVAIIASAGVVGLSIASIVLVILTGHSGAEVTWANRVASDSSSVVPSPTPTPTVTTSSEAAPAPAPSEKAVDQTVLSLELVAQRNTPEACWSVVDGSVYDLTAWIAKHPGGSRLIIGMCGRDATADFNNQHGGQSQPASYLAEYLVGKLGEPAP